MGVCCPGRFRRSAWYLVPDVAIVPSVQTADESDPLVVLLPHVFMLWVAFFLGRNGGR